MTNVLILKLEKLTLGGGAYLDEGNFRQPDFRNVFYGSKYKALEPIKNKYPGQIYYFGWNAVSSNSSCPNEPTIKTVRFPGQGIRFKKL
jgi:hypothetical protein